MCIRDRILGAAAATALAAGTCVATAGAFATGAVADGSEGRLEAAVPGAAGAAVVGVTLDVVVAVVAADCAP